MKERLTNNLGLKLLSVFLAFFVWLFVSNVSNPLISDSVDVQVDIINEEILTNNNLTYEVVGKNKVTVSYEVHTLDRHKIKASDFRAYADLSELYDVTGSIPVKVEMVNNKALIDGELSTKPGVVQVKTEAIQRKRFPLEVRTVGSTEEGYAVGEIALAPDYIYVTGAESVIGKISTAGVEVELNGADSDFSGTIKPVFYDANGNRLEDIEDDISLHTSDITYQVSILKVKNLGLDFQVGGEVADGYRFTGVESDVKSISVEGRKATLASLTTVTVPKELLNLNGATRDVVVKVDLAKLLPDNIKVAGNQESVATVVLKVEPLETRGFKLSTQDIELNGASEDLEYTWSSDAIQVDVQGLAEDLDNLVLEDLHPYVNVSGMGPGTYQPSLTIDLGDGFQLERYGEFEITAVKREESAESVQESTEAVKADESTEESTTAEMTSKETTSKEAISKETAVKETE